MPAERTAALDRGRLAGLRAGAERPASMLPGLMVEADRVASMVSQGVHGRRRTGVGETFWQYRPYQQGEPATAIDWRQSARSRHLFVREQEWEAAQSVYLWVDQSASMRFRSAAGLPFKRDRAVLLALAAAALLVRGGEQVAFLEAGARPRGGRFALSRMAEDMLAAAASGAALPPPAPVPRHARLVLIGDGLGDPDALAARLGALAERHVDGVLMQIVDPAEAELPFAGRVMFDGLEGEGSALIGNVGEVRERYRRLFRAHGEALRDMARRRGWTFVRHRTDRSAESGLLALYQSMAPRRGH